MADSTASSSADVLKLFAQKVTTSSVKERRNILAQVSSCACSKDLPENAIKGIFKYLYLTLGRYQDRRSRNAVLQLVKTLAGTYTEASLKAVTSVLLPFAELQKIIVHSKNISLEALAALSWTCVVADETLQNQNASTNEDFKILVSLQCLLVYGCLAARQTVISKVAYKKVSEVWEKKVDSPDIYTAVLGQLEFSPHLVCLLSFVMKYFCYKKNKEAIKKLKTLRYLQPASLAQTFRVFSKYFQPLFVDVYLKQILASRTVPPFHVLECSNDLLKHLNHEEFSELVLPAAQKAMLRNPEIILQAIEQLLFGLKLDLSQYAMDLGKTLAKQLCAKAVMTREEATKALKALAMQSSDPDAVRKLITHLFAVLNGSEGKLTTSDQRVGVMQGIGVMSNHVVSGQNQIQNLSSDVCELTIPILQQEVHEGMLVQALLVLTTWCARFYTEIPDKLIEWFKKGIGLKTSTSSVRNAYIRCMGAAFQGDALLQAERIIPVLLQVLEKANNQSSQTQLVAEALSASCILIRLSLVDIQAESRLGYFWNTVLDMDKQLMWNEKFLTSVSEDVMRDLVFLIEKLVVDFPHKMTEKISRNLYRAFSYCLTSKFWTVRRKAYSTLKPISSLPGAANIHVEMIMEFSQLLSIQKLPQPAECLSDGETPAEQSKQISPKILVSALQVLCLMETNDVEEAENLAIAAFMPAHHPCMSFIKKHLWQDILKKLKQNPKTFVNERADKLLEIIFQADSINTSMKNAVSSLVSIAPDAILSPLTNKVCELLSDPKYLKITKMEYGVYHSPPDQLYDRSIIEEALKSEVKNTNIKRENKLYSYEEQMAEIELRKEIQQRKKGKGIVDQPKLTKKQEGQVQIQLKKEAEIREMMEKLDSLLVKACNLVRSALKGNRPSLCCYMTDLCKVFVPLLKSMLAADRACQILLELAQASFEDKQLGLLVSNVTIRILKPECDLNPCWLVEQESQQTVRTIHLLHQCVHRSSEHSKFLFSAPTFSYFFYLLSSVLSHGEAALEAGVVTKYEALELICDHAKMRYTTANKSGTSAEMYDPQLLPHTQMVELLLNVIGTSSGKLAQMAHDALTEVACCLSGKHGCALITPMEINVFLSGTESPSSIVRKAILQVLLSLADVLPSVADNYQLGLQIARKVWVTKHDVDEEIRSLATKLQELLSLEEPYEEICTQLIDDVVHLEEVVRSASAQALFSVLKKHKHAMPAIFHLLLEKYEELSYLPPPELDEFGRTLSEPPPDKWCGRSGIAMALLQVAPLLTKKQIEPLFSFFVPKALGDRNPEVQKYMREAALAAVVEHGKENVAILLPVFEDFLSNAPDTAANDLVRQSIVILMGSLAKHLSADDPRVKPIMAKLIGALSTPSQEVQIAVAQCLPPLVPTIKADAASLVQKLLRLLLDSDNYGERKGASYGLAGLIKGLGIVALKQMDIMTTLTKAIQDKKKPRRREGALFAFEMLCGMLGKLFEPYVVVIIPHLLLCFGDSNQYVREAADDTAKAVMSNLSAHGVKFVLPSLLKGLEEDAWRTKTGSVELLGAMAHCAPKQLSACLPNIVPKLIDVLTDSHNKVQKSGAQALHEIGSVIRNPEIQAIVPVLLDALQEPSKKTFACLQTLLETKFVHFIDAASLALIMPVVKRAFQDRATNTRKMAAQIIGNMYSLTDQKDLVPYLPAVIPGLKQSLLDPVPEVRNVSSRALGAMVKGMGESSFDDLLPWLMQTLVSESSSVDRSGAAQGLSEVIGGMGLEKLEKLIPDIIQTAERNDIAPHVRDGYIMMFIYLPAVFGHDFMHYVGPILPSILKALADESEYVRDTALKAGQRIINLYADTAVELLLPELEKGLFDDNWRIRYSSVQLLGDLLYRISGVTGKMSTEGADDDDNFGTESSQKAILRCLGANRRNRVLAGLYMGRSDTAPLVCQSALHVWKIIVTNTPRTLREILPVLFSLLLGCLASTSYDKRKVAARTLGDLVRKLGQRVLPEIIPILEKGLDSDRSDQRQGVCIGLSEIMASTSRDHVSVFAGSLIPSVRRALCDPLPEVRKAAARTFDNLHANIGQAALNEILPDLLKKLGEPDQSEQALDGLKQVMAVKSRVVLPYLVPQLTTPPVDTRALAFLSSVAGDVLSRHLGKILPALLSALSDSIGAPDEREKLEYCQFVVLSVTDGFGISTIMNELLTAAANPQPERSCAAVIILGAFCSQSKSDFTDFYPQLFRGLISLFTRKEPRVLLSAWSCLDAITKKLDTSEMLQHITNIRQAVRFAISDFKEKELPGFSIPKEGITPVLPIFREGILNGSPEMKESAAEGLGEVISLTSAEALKTSVVSITGPLIRILGDRFPWNVKVAVLETLTKLLAKVGVMLKPFLPQLQTTFTKALNDSNRSVRLKAAGALGKLMVIHTRVDPLFTELHGAVKNAEDTNVKDTMLQALRTCISGAGGKVSPSLHRELAATLLKMLNLSEDSTRITASGCLGALSITFTEDELTELLTQHLFDTDPTTDWRLRHGRSIALAVALKEGAGKLCTQKLQKGTIHAVIQMAAADRIPICLSGLRAAVYMLSYQISTNSEISTELVSALVRGMKHNSNEVKQLCAQVVSHLARTSKDPLPTPIMKSLIPVLVNGTKEKSTTVKGNSEYALLAVLHLYEGESTMQMVCSILDVGMQESLRDLYTKSLRKLLTQQQPVREEIDDSILR